MPVGKKEIFITFKVGLVWLKYIELYIIFWNTDFWSPCLTDHHTFLVCIQVQKSPVFRREGADVHSDLFVSVAQAVLGGTARTQGLYETLNLSVSRLGRSQATSQSKSHWRWYKGPGHSFPQIPAGVQADQRIRLSGKGIARISGYGFGDHYVHVKIKVPK